MTHASDSTGHISLHVRDREGAALTVHLTVDERDASGTLGILAPGGGASRQFALTHLQKAPDNTQLSCHVSGTTATFSLERDRQPAELHVVASLVFPIFEGVYQMDAAEIERLGAWIDKLGISTFAPS
jgi:hypothetical protein